uniref:FYVE-type domain-containing protein n=1 Tax=Peronospora matthiolae TaxID=2874970 RepID=A0AAV1UH49_9STRA
MVVKHSNIADQVPDHIHLSVSTQQALTDTADAIIAETLDTYEGFVANGRQLPSDEWKHVKSREKIRVYRARKRRSSNKVSKQKKKTHSLSQDEKDPSRPRFMSAGAMEQHQHQAAVQGRPCAYDIPIPEVDVSSTATHSSSSNEVDSSSLFDHSVLANVKPCHIPLMVATGEINGSLEDVAYGGLANSKHAWLVRNSYVHNDIFDDRKILATFQLPNEEDPFRSVTLKWGTVDYGAFTTRRDFLYLESQGMAFDSDGERVFYYLIHSIELPECPPLDSSHNVIRVQLSVCYIARQLEELDVVEMFGRGFVDLRGDMMASYSAMILANNITSSAGVVECSNMRKLSYLMTLRRRSDTSGVVSHVSDCGVCHKPLSKLGSLLQSPISCPICRQIMCSKCSVQKKLTIEASSEVTQKKSFTFCLLCVIEAKELSAWEVAVACLRSKGM